MQGSFPRLLFPLSGEPLTQPDLDRRIEAWLKERFDLDVDFEVDDALAKLERLGLLKRDGEQHFSAATEGCARTAGYCLGQLFPVQREGAGKVSRVMRRRGPASPPPPC